MVNIKRNNWYVNGNNISTSLMKFHVSIDINVNEDGNIFYKVRVQEEPKKYMIFNFDTLEEAIYFAENAISRSWDLEDVINVYNNLFMQNTLVRK